MRRGSSFPLLGAIICASAFALPVAAQLVTPRTVPVLQGDQFEIQPSARFGMAGVTLALDDTLLDPFINPAKGGRLRQGRLFGVPFVHGITEGRGGGRTLPFGAYFASGKWSGGGVVAIQQLDRSPAFWNAPIRDRTAANQYASATLARRLRDSVSVGASVSRYSLGAIDGVDALYAGSDRIAQSGGIFDGRIGILKEWTEGRTFELLVLHSRTNMTHDVHFPAFSRWLPNGAPVQVTPERFEHNADRTHIWGVHSEFVRPVGREGWRMGWAATANRLSHPKIPNYVLMNIPRDPGTTYAYNVGVGLGRAAAGNSFGIDLVHEPIWSETWADAASDTARAGGGTIRAGEHTVDNRFRFNNMKVRLGLGRERLLAADGSKALGVQVGLGVHSIRYRLEQDNQVTRVSRSQREEWMEWSPSFALRFRTKDLELQYAFRATCATGGCDIPPLWAGGDDVSVSAPAPGGVIVAPAEPLTFRSGMATVHRFSFVIPLR